MALSQQWLLIKQGRLLNFVETNKKKKVLMNFHFLNIDNITNNNLCNNQFVKQINSTNVNSIMSISSFLS